MGDRMSGSIPRISVLMPVYNAAPYLHKAVESILNQTVADFEFIIVDDGSEDASPAILDGYTDPRIVRLNNAKNVGITKSLNQGLQLARGEYVARMDADDIAHPLRFEKQLAFLSKHSEVGVLGTAVTYIDASGQELGTVKLPGDHNSAVWTLVFGNPFTHPTIMARRALLLEAGGYRLDGPAQDRELWIRLYRRTRFANLSEPLHWFRLHDTSVTSIRRKARMGLVSSQYPEPDLFLRRQFLQDVLGRDISAEEVEWLTNSQRVQSTLDAGLDEAQIEAVVALMLEIFEALVRQSIFVGDYSQVKQDLVKRIVAASRYSPQCVMPGRLARQWRHPIRRRLLLALRLAAKMLNIWPEEWK